jgi:AraC-like DNA-binding protein
VNTQRVEAEVFALRDEQAKVRYVESFLRERLPAYDENINLIEMIINHISSNPDLMRVDDLVEELGLNKRTVQDMFHRYVGVSPKWVINRYRLQEATERLDQGDAVQFTHLAHELGYFDQAHFIKDFKAIIGKTPTEYAAEVR